MHTNSRTQCPLCDTPLEHREHDGTYAYVCPECPFIGFEYITDVDYIRLRALIR